MVRRRLPCRAVLILVAMLVQWAWTPDSSAAFKNVSRGDTPPAFAMKDLAGREWKSADLLDGKVAVVVFWAAWSPRSREILEDLEKLRAELGGDAFRVIAVNAEHVDISSADRKAIAALAAELKLSALVLVDEGLVAFNDFGVMALPSSLVVDTGGKVSFDLAGYPTTMRSDLADAVRKALGLPTSEELRPPEEYVPANHALMYYNFGKKLMEKGQDEKGEAQLRESIERDPVFVKPRVMLGILLKGTGRLEEALEQFDKVRELDPANAEAGYQAAAVSLAAGKFSEAESLFRGLHDEFPTREEFALGLALSLKYQGKEKDYLDAMGNASEIEPAGPRALYEFGGVVERQGDLGLAASLYRRSIEGSLRSSW